MASSKKPSKLTARCNEIQCTFTDKLTGFEIASKPEMHGKDQAIGGKIGIDNQRRFTISHLYSLARLIREKLL